MLHSTQVFEPVVNDTWRFSCRIRFPGNGEHVTARGETRLGPEFVSSSDLLELFGEARLLHLNDLLSGRGLLDNDCCFPALQTRSAKSQLTSFLFLWPTNIGVMLPHVAWLGRLVPRIRPQRTAIAPRRNLSTLNPARMTHADYVDLSGRGRIHGATFWTPRKAGSEVELHFPSQTQGFFYYVPGPAHAPVAGEVRFRITSNAEPASFEHGHDLLLPHSPAPWRIPLIAIIQRKQNYALMFEQLRKDGAIGDDLVAHLREEMSPVIRRTMHIVHSLGQPFHHEIAKHCIQLRVAAGNVLSASVNVGLPREYSGTYVGGASGLQCFGGGANMYTARLGHILCCFEPIIRNGRQALALRVLETWQLQ
jgi:hypothetical protein